MRAVPLNLRLALRSLSSAPTYAAMAVLLPSLGAAAGGLPCDGGRTAVVAVAPVVVTRPAALFGESPKTEFSIVTPEYFRASGVRLVRGRMFDVDDRADGPPVVIVNEALARRYWPDEDPIGRVITLDGAGAAEEPLEREVVGVVTNVQRAGQLDADPAPAVYLPLAQSPYPFL